MGTDAMHIGLIAGIGPAATDFYYRGLIARHSAAGIPPEAFRFLPTDPAGAHAIAECAPLCFIYGDREFQHSHQNRCGGRAAVPVVVQATRPCKSAQHRRSEHSTWPCSSEAHGSA